MKKPYVTLDDFAKANDLELIVVERDRPVGDPARYYAKFRGCEVSEPGVLVSMFGDGATPIDAVRDYIPRIMRKILVTYRDEVRTEIPVPRLQITSLDAVPTVGES